MTAMGYGVDASSRSVATLGRPKANLETEGSCPCDLRGQSNNAEPPQGLGPSRARSITFPSRTPSLRRDRAVAESGARFASGTVLARVVGAVVAERFRVLALRRLCGVRLVL